MTRSELAAWCVTVTEPREDELVGPGESSPSEVYCENEENKMPLYAVAVVIQVEANSADEAWDILSANIDDRESIQYVSQPISVTARMEESAEYDVTIRYDGRIVEPVNVTP